MEYTCTYLCPIRSTYIDAEEMRDFNDYWELLSNLNCEVLVVDGSPPEVFSAHKNYWSNCRHIPVDSRYRFQNGKVNGMITGAKAAKHEYIIMGDDDIRYEPEDIQRMIRRLEEYDLVRPQNYFSPSPWWTNIDAGRILLNRAYFPEGDFPGTLGFRKTPFLISLPYDGDVLFDNEEVVKHLQNRGAEVLFDRNFFIRRKPPSFEKWLEQRPRQAYEDFVMKKRTAFFLAFLPTLLLLSASKKKKTAGFLAAAVGIFSMFRARKGRSKEVEEYLPAKTLFYAPLWIFERSISIYLALYWRITKGGYPFGDKVIKKGTGRAWTENKQAPNLHQAEGSNATIPLEPKQEKISG